MWGDLLNVLNEQTVDKYFYFNLSLNLMKIHMRYLCTEKKMAVDKKC